MRTMRWAVLTILVLSIRAEAGVLFDFNSATQHSGMPSDETVGGITAHLTGGYYFDVPTVTGANPPDFTGLCLVPTSIFASDLLVSFNKTLTDFSIMYAPQELSCDSSSTMQVTAKMGSNTVGSNTSTAPEPWLWPEGTLTIHVDAGFDNVVVHFLSGPPTGGDWGPIFVADNMVVTAAAVPEPGSLGVLGLGAVQLIRRRRR